jgi:hypothetical protein
VSKLSPLTAHALGVLVATARDPVLCLYVNPGVRRRLAVAELLVERVELPSRWAAKGKTTAWHLRILDAGRRRILELTGSNCQARGCLAGSHRCHASREDLRAEVPAGERGEQRMTVTPRDLDPARPALREALEGHRPVLVVLVAAGYTVGVQLIPDGTSSWLLKIQGEGRTLLDTGIVGVADLDEQGLFDLVCDAFRALERLARRRRN